MPNDASQRTWGKDVLSVPLNKRIGDKQYIIHRTYDCIYLSTMDPDGTQWKPIVIAKIDGEIALLACDVYDNEIYAVITRITDSVYYLDLMRFDLDGNVIFNNDNIVSSSYGFSHFDFTVSKLYYGKFDSDE